MSTSEINHLTLEEALVSPEKEHWKEAMKKEVKTLEDMEAWEPVSEIPQGHTPIDTKWVLKKKTDGSGNLVRYKARLVARGFKAKKGTHYQSTFSPVLNFATLRTLLALAVLLEIVPILADVTNAYIHAEVINLVYITLPWGQKARLLKALYGMPDSAQLWYNKLKSILLSLGYQRSISDPAVFIKDTRPKTFNVIGIYVDDTIILIRNNDERQQLLTNLRKRLDITTQEAFNLILGINFFLDKQHCQTYSGKVHIPTSKEMEYREVKESIYPYIWSTAVNRVDTIQSHDVSRTSWISVIHIERRQTRHCFLS